jgi:BolA protein
MDRIESLRERITAKLEPESVEISDDSALHAGHAGAASGGGHFAVRIVSVKFHGKSMLERHRMVYQAVDDLIPAEIHALSIKALTPEELS